MMTPIKNKGLEAELTEYKPMQLPPDHREYYDTPNKLIVREDLGRFLPNASLNEVTIIFEQVVDGREVTSGSKPVGKGAIPITELDALEAGVKEFLKKKDSPASGAKARAISESFRLPDPDVDPEMYRFYGPPWNRRLLALWGCESEVGASLPPLEAVKKLRRNPKPLWRIWWERVFWLLLLPAFLLLAIIGLFLANGRRQPAGGVPPSISVQPQDRRAPAGVDASFSVTASGASPLAYLWLFNGSNISAGFQSSFTRFNVRTSDAGKYSVVVTNAFGAVTSTVATLTVVSETPSPAGATGALAGAGSQFFRVAPTSALLPTNVTAWAEKPGTVDFHGQKKLPLSPGKTNSFDEFSKPGAYRVEWTPDDSNLNIEAKIVRLTLVSPTNVPRLPVASLQLIPRESQPGQPVRADERASFHGDPARKLVKFEINWNGQFQSMDDATRVHIFTNKGKYVVALRVTDDLGKVSTDTETAYIGIAPPSATEKPPIPRLRLVSKNLTNLTAIVSDDGSTAPSGKIASWTLNWGDRSADARFTTAPTNIAHVFATNGLYLVALTCVDDKERPSHSAATVEVDLRSGTNAPVPPQTGATNNPFISLNVSAREAGRKVTFGASVDAFDFPVDLETDFGDQSPGFRRRLPGIPGAEKRNEHTEFSHDYAEDKEYQVRTVATDAKGRSVARTNSIVIASRQFEIVKTANEPVDQNRVKVSFLVRDKQDNNATDFSVRYWMVNEERRERAERDYTATFAVNTTNTVYAATATSAGSVKQIGIRVIIDQKIVETTTNNVRIDPLAPR